MKKLQWGIVPVFVLLFGLASASHAFAQCYYPLDVDQQQQCEQQQEWATQEAQTQQQWQQLTNQQNQLKQQYGVANFNTCYQQDYSANIDLYDPSVDSMFLADVQGCLENQAAITNKCQASHGTNATFGSSNSTTYTCSCQSGYVKSSLGNNFYCVTPQQYCSDLHASWDGTISNAWPECQCLAGYNKQTSPSGLFSCVPASQGVSAPPESSPSPASNGIVLSQKNSTTASLPVASTTAQTMPPQQSMSTQTGFWSKLFHLLNPFSWLGL